MAGERGKISRILVPVENLVYRVGRIDVADQMNWKRYLSSVLVFSLISLVVLMAILMLQGVLPLNPEGFDGLSWHLAFNTAASFVTNTNWQSYSGEATLSYFSQAIGLTVQNFVTPAVGMAVLFALFRGLVGEDVSTSRQLLRGCDPRNPLRALAAVLRARDSRRCAGFPSKPRAIRDGAAARACRRRCRRQHRGCGGSRGGRRRRRGRRARRASGKPGRHQAARHQRRRLQRRELRKPA